MKLLLVFCIFHPLLHDESEKNEGVGNFLWIEATIRHYQKNGTISFSHSFLHLKFSNKEKYGKKCTKKSEKNLVDISL